MRVSHATAARANGTTAHALDYDDVPRNFGYPTPPLLLTLGIGSKSCRP
jgi:hypothetical protein